MQQQNLNYVEARQAVTEGNEARRGAWAETTKIRMSNTADHDFINCDNLDGCVVKDCPSQVCDSRIGLYSPTQEDQMATDWEILKN